MAPARRSRSARHVADDPTSDNDRPSSRRSRRDGATGSARRSSRRSARDEGSGRRRPPGETTGRRDAVANTTGKHAVSGRHSSASSRRGDRNDRSARRPRSAASPLKSRIILGIILTLGLGLLGTAIFWYPIQKTLCAREMRTAEGDRSEQLVSEFLELSECNENDIKKYVTYDEKIPATTRLRVIEEAASKTDLRTAMFPDAMHIAKRCADDKDIPDCIRALEVASKTFLSDRHQTAHVPAHDLEEWATQAEREQRDRALGEAAIAFVGRIAASANIESLDILLGIINSTRQDPEFVGWALTALARLTDETNVGRTLLALNGPSGDLAARHHELVDAVKNNIKAEQLPEALQLINHQSMDRQAAGFKLLTGDKILLSDSEPHMALRERIASEVNLKLTAETLEQSSATMLQLVNAIRKHRLTDTTTRLLELAGLMFDNPEPDSQQAYKEAINALGVFFISTATDATKQAAEKVLGDLAKSIPVEAQRPHIIKAIQLMEPKAKVFEGTYACLLALVIIGDADSLKAAAHLTDAVYGREGLSGSLGETAQAWKDFMAMDKPRQEKYFVISKWYEENKNKITRGGNHPDLLRANYTKSLEYHDELAVWKKDSITPLAVKPQELDELVGALKKLHDGIRKFGMGAVDDAPADTGGGAAGEGGQVPQRRPPLTEGL